jgi:nitrate/TMAO reductase-like tetraheme cytochrome c subunit
MGALLAIVAPAAAQPAPAAPTNEDCQACHGDPSMTRSNGQPIVVPVEKFSQSVHGGFACVDCHADLATLTELPHPEDLAEVRCAACHDAAAAEYARGIHAQARRNQPDSRAARCVDCHGSPHEILSRTDPASPTNKLNVAKTCAACHGNKAPVKLASGRSPAVGELFHDSIHGQALERKGLIVAPSCGDCHQSHAIIPKQVPESPVHRTNVPATCGKCHEGIRHEFAQSAHGVTLAGGNAYAPNCASCHNAHGIASTGSDDWQLHAVEQCGTCHREALATYRDTFHGQVTALGFTPVAKCADCHTPHGVLPAEDPRSRVHEANLVKTCGQCHDGANENFVQYNPHANKHDKARSPVLYYAARFMEALLVFVFAFFGVHTMMWFSRGRSGARPPSPPARALKRVPPPKDTRDA